MLDIIVKKHTKRASIVERGCDIGLHKGQQGKRYVRLVGVGSLQKESEKVAR